MKALFCAIVAIALVISTPQILASPAHADCGHKAVC
jgi:hypothetical protein